METLKDTLATRVKTHGPFDMYADCAQALKKAFKSHKHVNIKLTDVQQEALDMIFGKIARIATGDPNCKDHWHDIAGYASLAKKHTYKGDTQNGQRN